ncbi:MAG: inositol monophosphatase, partial [Candidatus Margulisbacteria bacterium]|nr:inositol monophosphatase [Candidatus Margulisiibacteriota bacterium]
AEDMVIKMIRQSFPDDNILAEESIHKKTSSPFTWIIDPLDGTHNYIRGVDIFGTSIGVMHNGVMVVGVIFMPVSKELYAAQIGKGAYKNGKRIQVSDNDLKTSTLIYDSTIAVKKGSMIKALDKLSSRVFNIRMYGSTARSLAYIAEGKADLEVEFNDKIWDFAAGAVLISEAGGHFTDFNGSKKYRMRQPYIACNARTYKQLLNILKSV